MNVHQCEHITLTITYWKEREFERNQVKGGRVNGLTNIPTERHRIVTQRNVWKATH